MASEIKDIRFDGDYAVWSMRMEGKIRGTYTGTFKFRCFLDPMQHIAANREQRELLGSNPQLADEHTSFLAYALSQLRQRIVEAPPFWEDTKTVSGMPGNVPDLEIVEEVLKAAVEAEVQYKINLEEIKTNSISRAKNAEAKILADQKNRDEEDDEAEDDAEA